MYQLAFFLSTQTALLREQLLGWRSPLFLLLRSSVSVFSPSYPACLLAVILIQDERGNLAAVAPSHKSKLNLWFGRLQRTNAPFFPACVIQKRHVSRREVSRKWTERIQRKDVRRSVKLSQTQQAPWAALEKLLLPHLMEDSSWTQLQQPRLQRHSCCSHTSHEHTAMFTSSSVPHKPMITVLSALSLMIKGLKGFVSKQRFKLKLLRMQTSQELLNYRLYSAGSEANCQHFTDASQ